MNANSILFAVTAHSALGDTGNKTGFWYEELAAPYYILQNARYRPVIIAPRAGRPPVDPGSEAAEFRTEAVERFAADETAQSALDGTITAEDAPNDFAAIFLVGGHGTMWDFPGWEGLGQLLKLARERNLPVGAVCHGVAGLLSYREGEQYPFVAGKNLTGFTNDEEAAVGLTNVVPFLLQDRLAAAGGKVKTGDPFHPHVVSDGSLVTGQNPASSSGAAEKLVERLSGK